MRSAQVMTGEAWPRAISALSRYIGYVGRAGEVAVSYIGGYDVLSRAHRGDEGALDAAVPINADEQRRAIEFGLQLITQVLHIHSIKWRR